MYLLITDETNLMPGEKERFFIYGGIFFPVEWMASLDALVDDARRRAGLRPTDEFKFDTRSRPQRVQRSDYTVAKKQVLDRSASLGVRFVACLVHHDIAWARKREELVGWGANTVLGAFHRFLELENSEGVCMIDRLPFEPQFRYLQEKHQRGLVLHWGKDRQLRDRIRLFGLTCQGASHVASVADIVLGSFRFCVNERGKDQTCKAMWPSLAKMLWKRMIGGNVYFREYGLLFRPKNVQGAGMVAEYDGLHRHLMGLV